MARSSRLRGRLSQDQRGGKSNAIVCCVIVGIVAAGLFFASSDHGGVTTHHIASIRVVDGRNDGTGAVTISEAGPAPPIAPPTTPSPSNAPTTQVPSQTPTRKPPTAAPTADVVAGEVFVKTQRSQCAKIDWQYTHPATGAGGGAQQPTFAPTANTDACAANKPCRRRFYFLHMRKAGGSNVRAFLTCIAQASEHFMVSYTKGDWRAITVDEGLGVGWHNESLGQYFSVTHLRNPVERVMSSYITEGRWELKDWKLSSTDRRKKNRTEANAIPLADWIEGHRRTPSGKKTAPYIANYYTARLLRDKTSPLHHDYTAAAIADATAVLDRFDLVLVMEKFSDPKYVACVKAFLNDTSPADLGVHRDWNTRNEAGGTAAGMLKLREQVKEAAKAREPDAYRRVVEGNSADTELYESYVRDRHENLRCF